jgi:hypothetical protein
MKFGMVRNWVSSGIPDIVLLIGDYHLLFINVRVGIKGLF